MVGSVLRQELSSQLRNHLFKVVKVWLQMEVFSDEVGDTEITLESHLIRD